MRKFICYLFFATGLGLAAGETTFEIENGYVALGVFLLTLSILLLIHKLTRYK